MQLHVSTSRGSWVSRRISHEIAVELERLFKDAGSALFSYACTLPGVNRSTAEDLVQATFYDAALSWDKLAARDLAGRRQWLFRVTRNKAIDQWRMNRHYEPISYMAEPTSADDDTAYQVLCSVDLELCWSVVKEMPRMRQKVAFLRWNEDWSAAEIADWLGIAQTTVRGHLKEARDELLIQLGAQIRLISDPEIGEGG